MMVTTMAGTGQFLFVLMAFSAQVFMCSSISGNYTDMLSLLEFKNTLSLDPKQALRSWNESNHFCSWEGILCRLKTPRRVISLNLTNQGVVGPISPSLGNLTLLRHLILPNNALTGTIPESLGHLHRLQILYLSNNTLQGRIPDLSNCSNLLVIDVYRNNLVGPFPHDLPPKLQHLQISYNNLTGKISASLANITTLKKLICVSNNFEGTIPIEFAKFPVLLVLFVGGNRIVGRFPEAILNLSTLTGLNLGFSGLSGEVPPNLGNSLPNLELLQLDYNFFQGNIPSSLVNATKLGELELSSNNFTGVIPGSIGKLSKLYWLNLEINGLEAHTKEDWEFMDSLANCTELQILSVAYNHLEGVIPSSLGNLSAQLHHLFMGANQLLSGHFPSGVQKLPGLTYLGLEDNEFTGVVPDWLGNLKSIQGISLNNNLFTGFIPTSLSNLSGLGFLYLSANKFYGQIPPSLGNLQMLEVLTIDNNNLHGNIPKEIFSVPSISKIWLSLNNITGQIHTDIGKARQLTDLQLSSNNLVGHIPDTLGDCESLENVELDKNIFSGSIPASLGGINSLKVLNFSQNNLTGSIPSSLGNLLFLEKLDLSFNHLMGEVPTNGVFKNVTAVRIGGNQELCGGPPELHLPACSITPLVSSKHRKTIVPKVVIPVTGFVLLLAITVIIILFHWRRNQKRKSILLPPLSGREFPKVSYGNIFTATEGFSPSNLIGRGRYSYVYVANLFQDKTVAVKVFTLESRGAQKSFVTECNALRNLRHRNLIPIITACSSIDSNGNDFKALVYEFMARGDLHKLLYSSRDDASFPTFNHITLAQRINIVVDVADALEYLHHNNQGTVVHCDLKPSNILLDENMTSHIGDFGLARFRVDETILCHNDSVSTSSVAIKGTIGYVAPEYAGGGEVSTAADVYSFGVVLLEIFIRKRPTDDMFNDGLGIVRFAEINFPDRVLEIVDPQLRQEFELSQETAIADKEKGLRCLISALSIGLSCTKPSPSERIGMQEVAAKLHHIKDAYIRGN